MKSIFAALGRNLWSPFTNPRTATVAVTALTLVGVGVQMAFPSLSKAFYVALTALFVAYFSKANRWVRIICGAAILLVVWPLVGTSSGPAIWPFDGQGNTALSFLMVQVFINATLALGLNLVVGFAGLLDLGYVAFFAGGAYLYAIFGSGHAAKFMSGTFPLGPWWFWACIPLAIAFAAFLGIALGVPVLRLRGDYLAIVTLGFGEIINVLAKNLDQPVNITNGAKGISGIRYPELFGWKMDNNTAFYFFGLLVVAATFWAVFKLERSRIGRAWAAMREDDIAAQAMGVPLVKMKLLAFATGASFAGVMGMLYAVKQQFINPDSFTLIQSVEILAMVILGGLGSIQGTVVGAIVLTVLKYKALTDIGQLIPAEVLSKYNPVQYQPLIFGLVLILMMIFRQEGLIPARRPVEDIEQLEAGPPITAGPSVSSKAQGG